MLAVYVAVFMTQSAETVVSPQNDLDGRHVSIDSGRKVVVADRILSN